MEIGAKFVEIGAKLVEIGAKFVEIGAKFVEIAREIRGGKTCNEPIKALEKAVFACLLRPARAGF